jgi:hypothetical protein
VAADVTLDRCDRFRRDRDDGCTNISELGVVIAQLREMPTTEWSRETSQEDQDDGSVSEEIVERERVTSLVPERESRCLGSD